MLNNFNKNFDISNQNEIINNLLESFSFISKSTIGKSVYNNEIISLSVGNTKNHMLLLAGTHGAEWLTSGLVLLFLYNVCLSIKNNKMISNINLSDIINIKGFSIVPCLNPDGTEISIHKGKAFKNLPNFVFNNQDKIWQSNANGVDLNHNFPAGFSRLKQLEERHNITGPTNTRFGGDFAVSEPETSAIISYCRSQNFNHAISFHSQGEEIYWRYGKNTPEKSLKMANILSKSSGYRISDPEGLAVGGGFKDWFIEEFSKPAFTIEIGKGKNPLPLNNLFPIYNRLEQMLVLSILM